MHVAVRADPRAIVESQVASGIAAEHRAVPDVDAASDVDMSRVEDQDPLLDNGAFPEEAEVCRAEATVATRYSGHVEAD